MPFHIFAAKRVFRGVQIDRIQSIERSSIYDKVSRCPTWNNTNVCLGMDRLNQAADRHADQNEHESANHRHGDTSMDESLARERLDE